MRCASTLLLITATFLLVAGCQSAAPCPPLPEPSPPNIVYQEVYRCHDLGKLPPIVLPIPPPFPDALLAQSAWCVDARDTVMAREAILWAAIKARDALIELMLTPPEETTDVRRPP